MVEWGNYAEAYKAIHDKLNEILSKIDNPSDPAVQDIIDRANRQLGLVYGSQNVPLQQETSSKYLQTIPYGSTGNLLQQRASTNDLLIQLRNAGVEIDPRQIRALTSSDVVDISDKAARVLGKVDVTDVTKTVVQKKIDLTATGAIHTPASGKKIRIKAFQWSCDADVITALRFGAGGDLLFPIQAKGVIAMNLVGCNIEGAVDEILNGYLSGSGNMKGTVLIEEV